MGAVVSSAAGLAVVPVAPGKCFQTNEQGDLPTCTRTDTGWEVSYPGAGPGSGPGGGFAAFFLFALLAGIAFTVWKVATARRMARDSGMDVGDATAMTLLTDEGFESTYLASNLRGQMTPRSEAAPEAPPRDSAERLRQLESLRTEGLITEEEYAQRRRAILDAL